MDDYKSLQTEFENFKKNHYVEHMKLKIKFSYLKDLFGKLKKERVILITCSMFARLASVPICTSST